MKLNQLRDNPGARKKPITVGRGIGSGKGKTGGRGVKGQKARTGVAIKGFEGGQMPLIRRMPKRGFTNPHKKVYTIINLDTVQEAIDSKKISASKPVDAAALIAGGVIHRANDGVSLLAKGELKTKVTLVVTRASAAAIKAVEKAGGAVEVLPAKVNKLLKEKKKASK
ncbi:MAG: 50S ribosomal protein L15 [Alphaproteobacteria bacterium]|nr:50S ribosomal protein L15 [Alphaproteobacteria bacterium]